MQDLALQTHFDGRAAQPEKAARNDAPVLRTNRVLNYVWINKTPDKDLLLPTDDTPLCSVPLHDLDKAYDNARKYPDTEVRIWIDETRLSDQTRFFVQSHAYLNAPDNVRIKDLNSVPGYRDKQDLYSDENVSIWCKVDLARFEVAAHSLRTLQAQTVFYADFDVKDVALDSAATAQSLKRYQTAFTRVPNTNIPSPGYFAASQEGLPVIENLISAMMGTIRSGGDHYQVFARSVPQFNRITLRSKFTDVRLPPENVRIPLPDIYRDSGICGHPPCKKYDLS